MSEKPSTSKHATDDQTPPPQELPPALDITSDEFDAKQALYANPQVKLTKRKPKIIYQNMAAFEFEYNRKGLYGLASQSSEMCLPLKEIKSSSDAQPSTSERRFLPHQMAIQVTSTRAKDKRNLIGQINEMEGPLVILRNCLQNGRQIKVYTRSEHGVRGTITGFLIYFDKHWNLLLRDVHETWKRRKYKYDENKFCGTVSDCSDRLRQLGITLPETKVKSLNRKNVELSRTIPKLFVRGEQVVLVISNKAEEKERDTKLKI